MEKFNIPESNSLDSMEGIIDESQNVQEKGNITEEYPSWVNLEKKDEIVKDKIEEVKSIFLKYLSDYEIEFKKYNSFTDKTDVELRYKTAKNLRNFSPVTGGNLWQAKDTLDGYKETRLSGEIEELTAKSELYAVLQVLNSLALFVNGRTDLSEDGLQSLVYESTDHYLHNAFDYIFRYYKKSPLPVDRELLEKLAFLKAKSRENSGQYSNAVFGYNALYEITRDESWKQKQEEMKANSKKFEYGIDQTLYDDPENVNKNIKLILETVEALKNHVIHKFDLYESFKQSSFSK